MRDGECATRLAVSAEAGPVVEISYRKIRSAEYLGLTKRQALQRFTIFLNQSQRIIEPIKERLRIISMSCIKTSGFSNNVNILLANLFRPTVKSYVRNSNGSMQFFTRIAVLYSYYVYSVAIGIL